ncbi:phenylalanine 4-monooxygenase [Lunatimonas salinarum]|uniref:phenylalanine 4-monooxygenase n=1 Tax=Lunatimonas salinarum TaxID=1774590 RepID=UPI001AE0B18A|nr:phenylalanine 4-monooxygenase [Lunatimonas salinarum]
MNFTELMNSPRLPQLTQRYDAYTEEDRKVWKLLYERQYQFLLQHACRDFLDGLKTVGFSPDRIPDFVEVNERLAQTTGWSVQVVHGLVDDDLFFGLLRHRRFPSSTWLRKISELDYLQEPDMFHDAFAHLPLLTNQPFVNFLEELAAIALDYVDNPLAIEMLSRIYWYTVEFGLIREQDELKVYGAGILSSIGETKFSLSDEPRHMDFDVFTILNTPFWKNRFQDRYFIIDDFDQLFASIPEIRAQLGDILASPTNDER